MSVSRNSLSLHLLIEMLGMLKGQRMQVKTVSLKPRLSINVEWFTIISSRLLHKICMSGKDIAEAVLLMIVNDNYDTVNACHFANSPDYRFLLTNRTKKRMLEQNTRWCIPNVLRVAGKFVKRVEWEVRNVDWMQDFFAGLQFNKTLEYMHESAGIALCAFGMNHYWYPELKSDFYMHYWTQDLIFSLSISAIRKLTLRLSRIPLEVSDFAPISKLYIQTYVIENVLKADDGFSIDYDILEYTPDPSMLETFCCNVPINAYIAQQMIIRHGFIKNFSLGHIALPVQDTNCAVTKLLRLIKIYFDQFCFAILNHPGINVYVKLVMYNERKVSLDVSRIMKVEEFMNELISLCGYFNWKFTQRRGERYIQGRFTQDLALGKRITMAVNFECVPEY